MICSRCLDLLMRFRKPYRMSRTSSRYRKQRNRIMLTVTVLYRDQSCPKLLIEDDMVEVRLVYIDRYSFRMVSTAV